MFLWNQCFCLFTKDTGFAFKRYIGGGSWHTFNQFLASHLMYNLEVGMTQAVMPGFNASRRNCNKGMVNVYVVEIK
jgi:hypothetical protein